MASFAEACQGVLAIVGKVLRRSFDTASQKSALHMVSAWACVQQLVLAQIAQLPAETGRRDDIDLINQGLNQHSVLSRLRAATPAAAASTRVQGVL